MANGRCRNHGGASLAGPAHPNFKDGRHSKYLQLHLGQRYQDAIHDTRLVGLRDEIALVDARVFELLEAVGQTGNTKLWTEAQTKFTAFEAAAGKGKDGLGHARAALQELAGVLERGRQAAATWDELAERIDLRRRLVDSEVRRQKELFQMISVDQAMRLMGQLVDEVKQRVKDPRVLADISAQFVRLVGAGDRAPAAAGRSGGG